MITSASAIAESAGNHRRLFQWLRILASYALVQAFAQGLGFLAGIIVVRSLSKADYACFVIVNTIGPAMSLLSDNGITSSLASIGGRVWRDDLAMGSLVNTAMALRRRLAVASTVLVTPLLVFMLQRNHAHFWAGIWLVSLTLAGVYLQIKIGVLIAVLNLRQQIGRMQGLVVMSATPRLLLLGVLVALGMINAPLAVVAGVLALAVQYGLLHYWVMAQIKTDARPRAEYRSAILAIIKRQAPLTIYFCLQSQIGIWVISMFGNAHRVAEVGALGRIGAIFAILVSTFSALVVPRFAREQDLARMRSRYLQILAGFAAAILSGVGIAWLAPGLLLWLLGAQYAQLGALVWLAVLASGSAAMAGLLYSLNVNKGWIPPAAIVIPAEIAVQIILFSSFDYSTVRGILLIGVIAPLVPGVLNIWVSVQKLRSLTCHHLVPAP
jgi:O-antigen/teichoic acid export membrane protein